MSRKNRTTAPPFPSWHGLPRELAPELYHVGAFARGLALDLFRLSDLDYQGRVAISGGSWESSLCCALRIKGDERRNAVTALRRLKGAGILLVHANFVTVCLGQSLDGLPAQIADDVTPVGSQSASTRIPLGSHSDPTRILDEVKCPESLKVDPTNRQTDKQRENADARTPARSIASRPDIIGFNLVASMLGRDPFTIAPLGSFPREYTWIGTRPATEREAVAKAVNADEWCRTNPGRVDAPHLQRSWFKYLEGKAKPVLVKAEPRGIWAKTGEAAQ